MKNSAYASAHAIVFSLVFTVNTYAIGDIHGCAYQFQKILDHIASIEGEATHQIITLGDYIDRGPASRQVLDILMQRPDIISLMGNHEQMLLDAATGDRELEHLFRINGGIQTLASFGVDRAIDIPSPYLDFVSSRRRWYEDEHRVFVHAGIYPFIDRMEDQPPNVLLWVRGLFLDHTAPFFKYVVHGHTPRQGRPDIRDNRVNLDAGCCFTGVLACGIFDDTQSKPLQVILAGPDKPAEG